MWEFLKWPEQASTTAAPLDNVFHFLNAVTIFFSLLIAILIVYFAVRYRRGNRVDRSNPPAEHMLAEALWTGIPGVICLVMFVWSTSVWFTNMRPPAGAMEIYVVGKQWMWKLQHPQGRWEMNQLHVPVGRPVKLILTSEDVIHSFFVPAFRVKTDVLPGRFVQLWFEATQVGQYHLFCTEYCGTRHSGMVGTVFVMQPDEYERWLRTGNTENTMAARGERLFRTYGCSGCHGDNSSLRAPNLDGIYGRPVAIEERGGGTRTIIADDTYIHDSIMLPEKEIAAGFKPIMPTYRGRITQEELVQIMEYIKSLNTSNGTANGQARDFTPLGGGNTIRNDVGDQREQEPLADPRDQSRIRNETAPLASPDRAAAERQ